MAGSQLQSSWPRPRLKAAATTSCLLLLLILLIATIACCRVDALWTQRNHDAGGTSCADAHTGVDALWCQATIESVRTGVQVAIHHASLDDQAIVDGHGIMYYIYKRTSLVAARINAPVNEFLWRVDLSPVPFGSNPALDPIRGIIYVVQGGPIAMSLLAYDSLDGRYLWKQTVEGVAAVSAPVVHPSGVVLIAVLNDAELSAIYAFDGPNTPYMGDLSLWNYTRTGSGAGVANAPAVGPIHWSLVPNPSDATNGTVYVLFSRDDDATLVALHPTTGHLIWEVTFLDSHPADVQAIVRRDGTILIAGRVVNQDGTICGDADTGLVIAVGNPILPQVPAGPSFALLGFKQVIGRIDPPDDDHIWSFTAEGEIMGATVDGSVLYVSAIFGALDQQGILYGLNITDGNLLWRLAVPSNDAIVGSAVVVGDGTLLWMAGQSIYRIGHCSGRGNCSATATRPPSSTSTSFSSPLMLRGGAGYHVSKQPVCSCNTDWYGGNCSVSCTQSQCAASMPIGAHTACGLDGSCECTDGWYPDGICTRQCDRSTCQQTHGNHAHCNDNGDCMCDTPYFAAECSKRCQHGTIHANGTICKCHTNYYGSDEHQSCMVFCERVETCSNHGTCGSEGQCICDESGFWSLSRYSGEECVDGLNMKPWLAIGLPLISFCLIMCVFRALRRARKAQRDQALFEQQQSEQNSTAEGGGDEDDSMTNGRSLHSSGVNTANNSTSDVHSMNGSTSGSGGLSNDLRASLLSSSTSSNGASRRSLLPPQQPLSQPQPAPPPPPSSLRSVPSLNSPRSGGQGPGPRGFALGSPIVNQQRGTSYHNLNVNTNGNGNNNNTNSINGNGNLAPPPPSRAINMSMPRSPSGSEPIGSGMAALTPKKFQATNPRQAMMNNVAIAGSVPSSSYIPPSSLSSNSSRLNSSNGAPTPRAAASVAPASPRAITRGNSNNGTLTRNNNAAAVSGLPAPLLLSPPTQSLSMVGSLSIPAHIVDHANYSPSSHDESPLLSPMAPPSIPNGLGVPGTSVVRSPTLPSGWKT